VGLPGAGVAGFVGFGVAVEGVVGEGLGVGVGVVCVRLSCKLAAAAVAGVVGSAPSATSAPIPSAASSEAAVDRCARRRRAGEGTVGARMGTSLIGTGGAKSLRRPTIGG
jgi:hypothetical protein